MGRAMISVSGDGEAEIDEDFLLKLYLAHPSIQFFGRGSGKRFRPVRVIGEGAYGVVLEVKDAYGDPNKHYALKVHKLSDVMINAQILEHYQQQQQQQQHRSSSSSSESSSSSTSESGGSVLNEVTQFLKRGRRDFNSDAYAEGDAEALEAERCCFFVRESDTILACQADPHVVRVYDIGFEMNSSKWMLMELCDTTLGDIRSEYDFETRSAMWVELAVQMLSALRFLHAHGIAHRDIKSSNILVKWDSRAPGGVTFKLCDFGMAKDMRRNWHTNTVGTLAYRAPEIITGSHVYDNKTDIWSLGVTLLDLICGRSVFLRSNEHAIKCAIAHVVGAHAVGLEHQIECTAKGIQHVIAEHRVDASKIDHSETFVAAVQDMLTADPTERPSARRLIKRYFTNFPNHQNHRDGDQHRYYKSITQEPVSVNTQLFTSRRDARTMRVQRINTKKYSRLLLWMMEVCKNTERYRCTYTASVELFERYLSTLRSSNKLYLLFRDAKRLHNLAICCIYLASCYYERISITPRHLCESIGHQYNPSAIDKLTNEILERVNHRISFGHNIAFPRTPDNRLDSWRKAYIRVCRRRNLEICQAVNEEEDIFTFDSDGDDNDDHYQEEEIINNPQIIPESCVPFFDSDCSLLSQNQHTSLSSSSSSEGSTSTTEASDGHNAHGAPPVIPYYQPRYAPQPQPITHQQPVPHFFARGLDDLVHKEAHPGMAYDAFYRHARMACA